MVRKLLLPSYNTGNMYKASWALFSASCSHTVPQRQVFIQQSGTLLDLILRFHVWKALKGVLASQVELALTSCGHFLIPQEWPLVAVFLTSMWTTSHFPHSGFPVCDWIPGSFLSSKNTFPKTTTLGKRRRTKNTKKNFSMLRSSFWQPLSSIAKLIYLSAFLAKDFLREQCYSSTWIFAKRWLVICYENQHGAPGSVGWPGVFQV